MQGENRADPFKRIVVLLEKMQNPDSIDEAVCVFISYQHEDFETCKAIADYLLEAGVNVYFDHFDKTLSRIGQMADPDKITETIQAGINNSTHMLCVVSPSTIKSYWVPFEVGYGYEKIELGILTLKGIDDCDLPDYMKTTRVIRGTRSLNRFISELLGQTQELLERKGVIMNHARTRHPLDRVLQWDR